MNKSNVYIQKLNNVYYPNRPPFHPNEAYPEYVFKDISQEKNPVYEAIRNLLYLMNLDRENWNTKNWNPFKEIVHPGNVVLIKPNLVIDNFKFQDCTTTHSSLIRAIIDYVIIALKGKGEIIVGDAPLQSCNFDRLISFNGLKKTVDYLKSKNINIKLIDFRLEKLLKKKNKYIKLEKNRGDPKGYKVINLNSESKLQEISQNNGYKKFRVYNYNPKNMLSVHNQIDHKYLICNSALQADVIISIPKIKSHKKAGITACLKNSIGINGHKDWLPHHRIGSCLEGGDEYLNKNIMKKLNVKLNEFDDLIFIKNRNLHYFLYYPVFFLKKVINASLLIFKKDAFSYGNWYGNDTLWRTIVDLNKILLYTKKSGEITSTIQKKILYFCDGVISGESEGPLYPLPNKTGIILGGFDPLIIDLAICELFNINYKKIPQISKTIELQNRKVSECKPSDLRIVSNYENWNNKGLNELKETLDLKLSKGWTNCDKIYKKN